jgi:hypothetical protein
MVLGNPLESLRKLRKSINYRLMRQYLLLRAPVLRNFSTLLGTKKSLSGSHL